MSDTIIYPDYFRIFECRSGRWFIKNLDTFYRTKAVDEGLTRTMQEAAFYLTLLVVPPTDQQIKAASFKPLDMRDHEDIKALFGITEQQVVIELFRINGGASGHYLANLRDQKYYYCVNREGVKNQLLELGSVALIQ